jgi:hypothetical protein
MMVFVIIDFWNDKCDFDVFFIEFQTRMKFQSGNRSCQSVRNLMNCLPSFDFEEGVQIANKVRGEKTRLGALTPVSLISQLDRISNFQVR